MSIKHCSSAFGIIIAAICIGHGHGHGHGHHPSPPRHGVHHHGVHRHGGQHRS